MPYDMIPSGIPISYWIYYLCQLDVYISHDSCPGSLHLTKMLNLMIKSCCWREHKKNSLFCSIPFYCIETICAPCGWWLHGLICQIWISNQYLVLFGISIPNRDILPGLCVYCKGCAVLHTSIANGSWESWKNTTRFIVDSYQLYQSSHNRLYVL